MKARLLTIIMAVALVALPTMAQGFAQNADEKIQPAFQSTSTMMPVNSQYSAQPMLNADGTAYNPAAASTPGVRKAKKDEADDEIGISTPGKTGSEAPLGDAVLPLMLMALAFGGVIALRRRKLNAGK